MRKTEKIAARITTAQRKKLERMARRQGVSLSQMVVHLVENSEIGGFLDGLPEEEKALMAHAMNFAGGRPELRHLLLWLVGNKQYMETLGHLLTPEEREAWAAFMSGLGRVFSAHLAGAINVERQKAGN